ncbi:hypothetical protein ACFO5R_11865 [Halosolutus amylolyticus]|uniref:Oxidoreductase n=1 Tax=Halosolutus amylolyticus TaxID=2932267 RepID=A0ABD5PPR5_9EURY|nr:hypothetical protein [Halosolutus amylolyticus]
MVLRCSLLGHDYGEPEVEREREERGSEVVVTVQEYEECARCGDRHVISENTEVTSLSTGTDADPRPDEPDADAEDAQFIDAEADADPTASDADDDDLDVPTDENGEPVTDDGEILEDDTDDARDDRDRGHGEWPDSDDVGPPIGAENEPEEWPDSEESEPIDDAVVLESDATTDPGDESDPVGVDAEPPDAETIEAEHGGEVAAGAAESGTGIERATAAPAPTESREGPDEDAPTELYCPGCGYVAGTDRSSLRTGDICPECRKGYLSEREQ